MIIKAIKKDFPILNMKNLIYLDNASTTQKPKIVINAIKNYYETLNSNIHRGLYSISEKSSEKYEETRKIVAKFINAKHPEEIIFTKNATESINLIAYSLGKKYIKKGDEIIISELEHHSNFIPWQQLAKEKKAKLKIIPLNKNYNLDFNKYKKLLSKKTKIVSLTAMSNVVGVIPPIKKFITLAKKYKALTIIDAAQSIAHKKTDVQKLNCDFLVFSAHKMLGPNGIGVLYGKKEILSSMPPFLYGGGMISEVKNFSSSWAEIPQKFEAGTQNIGEIISFSLAIKYLEKIGFEKIKKHQKFLHKYAIEKFSKYKEITIYTPKTAKNGIISFNIKNTHPHDIAEIFNKFGVAIRAGHHCAQPLMRKLKIPATARISFYIYNTKKDIDIAEKAIKKVVEIFN